MNILNEQTENVPINSIRPHERNVNEGDLGQIIQSIDENGFWGTVIVQKSTGKILAGNHRWIAAKDQGATEIPVTYVDVDDELARRILLADNRITRLGHDNPSRLAEELA